MCAPDSHAPARRWVATLLLAASVLLAAPAGANGHRLAVDSPHAILFVGNSFTFYNNSVYTHLRKLLMAEDPATRGTIFLKSMTISGAVLADHEGGLGQMLALRPWDIVVLQGHSLEAIEAERKAGFSDAAARFTAAIRAKGAEPVLFMTWAYADRPGMTAELEKAYTALGAELGVTVVPVGLAFAAALADDPGLELHVADKVHPSVAGTYLAACVFYATLYGKSPAPLAYDAGLDPATARTLRKTAWRAVSGYDLAQ